MAQYVHTRPNNSTIKMKAVCVCVWITPLQEEFVTLKNYPTNARDISAEILPCASRLSKRAASLPASATAVTVNHSDKKSGLFQLKNPAGRSSGRTLVSIVFHARDPMKVPKNNYRVMSMYGRREVVDGPIRCRLKLNHPKMR